MEFSLIYFVPVSTVKEYAVDRVYAFKVHVNLRKCRDVRFSYSLVYRLRCQVESVEWYVKSLLCHYLVKRSVHLLLKHYHIPVYFKFSNVVASAKGGIVYAGIQTVQCMGIECEL